MYWNITDCSNGGWANSLAEGYSFKELRDEENALTYFLTFGAIPQWTGNQEVFCFNVDAFIFIQKTVGSQQNDSIYSWLDDHNSLFKAITKHDLVTDQLRMPRTSFLCPIPPELMRKNSALMIASKRFKAGKSRMLQPHLQVKCKRK